ncbi:MAG TPA: nucleotidyltransferase family protein [Steroidobacteraceae bacterium]|nr:nucleotidyltransferase family protein [Steroidobacteraceae bacterium]
MNANGSLPHVHAVVLAAGFSSRLGRPKALARVRSLTLLRRTLAVVARLSPAKIIVVLPPQAVRYRIEARGLKVAFVANSNRAAGLSSSVHRGIAQARYSTALLLLPVDLAGLKRRDLARLISRWRSARRCVIARRIDLPNGRSQAAIPLILPRWLYPRALAVTGDIGLRELVNGLPSRQRVLLELPSAALDVDTPQDLRTARSRLAPNSQTGF